MEFFQNYENLSVAMLLVEIIIHRGIKKHLCLYGRALKTNRKREKSDPGDGPDSMVVWEPF